MGFLKQEVNLEDFCRDFYDNQILNPVIGGVDAGVAFATVVKKNLDESDSIFIDIDLKKLADEIIDHEPIVALDGGHYGINFFRRLINGASTVLKRGGVLIFEIGNGQERLIKRLFAGKE